MFRSKKYFISLSLEQNESIMRNDWKERIVVDPKVLAGKPVIKGTRLSVEFILGLPANDWTIQRLLDEYPQLKQEDIIACLKYAT